MWRSLEHCLLRRNDWVPLDDIATVTTIKIQKMFFKIIDVFRAYEWGAFLGINITIP